MHGPAVPGSHRARGSSSRAPPCPRPGPPVLPRPGAPRGSPSRAHPCPTSRIPRDPPSGAHTRDPPHRALLVPASPSPGGRKGGRLSDGPVVVERAISPAICSEMGSYSRVRNARRSSKHLKNRAAGGMAWRKVWWLNYRAAALPGRVPCGGCTSPAGAHLLPAAAQKTLPERQGSLGRRFPKRWRRGSPGRGDPSIEPID